MRPRLIVSATASCVLLLGVGGPASAATPNHERLKVVLVDVAAGHLAVAIAVADPGTGKDAANELAVDDQVLTNAGSRLIADLAAQASRAARERDDEEALTAFQTVSDAIASQEASWVTEPQSNTGKEETVLFGLPCAITPKTIKLPCAALLLG